MKASNKKRQAARRGIEWKISEKDFQKLRNIKKCHYTGIDLIIAVDEKQFFNTWTLDRIDSNGPYSMDNVVVCSRDANLIKNVLCQEQLKMFDPKMVNAVMQKLQFNHTVTTKSKWKQIIEILFN